jgi:hypothetical protein
MSGPGSPPKAQKRSKSAEKPPPGVFLSDDLALDTARFVAEAKERAKNRSKRRGPTLGGR